MLLVSCYREEKGYFVFHNVIDISSFHFISKSNPEKCFVVLCSMRCNRAITSKYVCVREKPIRFICYVLFRRRDTREGG